MLFCLLTYTQHFIDSNLHGTASPNEEQFSSKCSNWCFCLTNPNATVLSKTVMYTNVDTNVIRNVMTQEKPLCLQVLNGCVVRAFCWYSLIHNPVTDVNTHCFAALSCWPCRKQAYSCMAASAMPQPSKPSGHVMQH